MQTTIEVLGQELAVGDTIDAWWGRDTITQLEPYTGTLTDIFPNARIARFARNTTGMTIPADEPFEVVARMV